MIAKRITWKTASNSQLRYANFKDFDFFCQSDVLVLNVNKGNPGNARSAFSPYTFEFNRQYVTRIYALYNQNSDNMGMSFSQEIIEGIIAYPKTTVCNSH